ncbi:MAG: response regulator [Phenylobacterium sp.]
MHPPAPLDQPFRVTCIDEELVFLGPGSIGFSMTQDAARRSFHHLAEALVEIAVAAQPQTSEKPAGLVVMMVEDEPLVREAGASVLVDAGYAVIKAAGANQALRALERGAQVHVLFTDIQMPGDLDGLELARVVSERWPQIRVLISSGQSAPKAEALPAKGRFLAKPYAATEMLRHIDELLVA